ncbi:MAG TPA: RluA family pseudouridine synthase [Spirochaetia bacterium]|nr:RluA family pseudouridine synthase [Spirochaetales bacterium]HRS65663.1 RluA family pseudouridine synthase [Spirochaetia bacterium]HOT58688.1 RluA family pseudouridine synthase [Spirochaetales bacterium]HPD79920.1 RluA family pseudouridine synthase [Spirochaetales bacterium]HQK33520.1 RluA family pseudouridine synthase [Spirochaetales bacterium]
MNKHVYKFLAGDNDNGRRVDRIVRKLFPTYSLSYIYKLIRTGNIKINGKKCKTNTIVLKNDTLEVVLTEPLPVEGINKYTCKNLDNVVTIKSFGSAPLSFLYTTPDVVIINKPRAIDVHGPHSIAQTIKSMLPNNSLSFTPAPVHRLDRNTSGLLIIALSLSGAQKSSKAFHDKQLEKYYLAVLEGTIQHEVVLEHYVMRDKLKKITTVHIEKPKSCSKALLKIQPLLINEQFTLAQIQLITGFTHQIRAQCSAYGHPLAGDKKYGSCAKIPYYFLHAWKIVNFDTIFSELPHVLFAPLLETQIEYLETYCQFQRSQINAIIQH